MSCNLTVVMTLAWDSTACVGFGRQEGAKGLSPTWL